MLARGKIPCDILFIGEAPGPSEDVIGQPFVGPAGKLLDAIIEEGIYAHSDWRVAFTNLVACIPKDETQTKFGEPPKHAIQACQGRLIEFVQLAKPQLIVRVGKLSQKWIPNQEMFTGPTKQKEQIQFADIVHPAAVLRADISQQGLAKQRCVVTLSDAVEQLTPF